MLPSNHPYDPENKTTDEEYEKSVDAIQNEMYGLYLQKMRWFKVLTRILLILLVIILTAICLMVVGIL